MNILQQSRETQLLRVIEEVMDQSGGGSSSRVGAALFATAALVLAALIAMLALVISSAPPPQLEAAFVADPTRFLRYRLGFVSASLLAPAFVTLLVLLLVARGTPGPGVRDGLGVLFLAMYAPLSSIAYTSQYVMLPRLIEAHPAAAASWYFHDSHSIPYTLDLLGYTFFGIAATLLALGFLARAGLWRWLGTALLLSGLTSILAFAALGAQLETTHAVLTITSAALTLPVAGIALVVGRRLRLRKAL